MAWRHGKISWRRSLVSFALLSPASTSQAFTPNHRPSRRNLAHPHTPPLLLSECPPCRKGYLWILDRRLDMQARIGPLRLPTRSRKSRLVRRQRLSDLFTHRRPPPHSTSPSL